MERLPGGGSLCSAALQVFMSAILATALEVKVMRTDVTNTLVHQASPKSRKQREMFESQLLWERRTYSFRPTEMRGDSLQTGIVHMASFQPQRNATGHGHRAERENRRNTTESSVILDTKTRTATEAIARAARRERVHSGGPEFDSPSRPNDSRYVTTPQSQLNGRTPRGHGARSASTGQPITQRQRVRAEVSGHRIYPAEKRLALANRMRPADGRRDMGRGNIYPDHGDGPSTLAAADEEPTTGHYAGATKEKFADGALGTLDAGKRFPPFDGRRTYSLPPGLPSRLAYLGFVVYETTPAYQSSLPHNAAGGQHRSASDLTLWTILLSVACFLCGLFLASVISYGLYRRQCRRWERSGDASTVSSSSSSLSSSATSGLRTGIANVRDCDLPLMGIGEQDLTRSKLDLIEFDLLSKLATGKTPSRPRSTDDSREPKPSSEPIMIDPLLPCDRTSVELDLREDDNHLDTNRTEEEESYLLVKEENNSGSHSFAEMAAFSQSLDDCIAINLSEVT